MTYMGHCFIGEQQILCTHMESAIQTGVQFHNHVVGLRDVNLDGNDIKRAAAHDDEGVGGDAQIQRRIYRLAPATVRCKISGPVTSSEDVINIQSLLEEHAIRGKPIPEANFTFFGGFGSGQEGHKAENLYVESMNINVVSGDVVSFDLDMIAKKRLIEEGKPNAISPCQKLLTWDKVNIATDVQGDVQAFTLSIKNDIIPIYTSSDKSPVESFIEANDMRIGSQSVDGTLSTYTFSTWQLPNDGNNFISFDLDGLRWKINVVYEPTPSAVSGNEVYVAPIPFKGVSDGPVWEKL